MRFINNRLEIAKSNKRLQAVVQLSSGALRSVDIDMNTTAKDLVEKVSTLLGLPACTHSPFGIFEGFHNLGIFKN